MEESIKVVFITPLGKPRMTKSDAWKKRECVARYWNFKNELKRALSANDLPVPYEMVVFIPMPKSWSKKKRDAMRHTKHESKPDKDNIEKAILDSIFDDDSAVWSGLVSKLWADEGAIVIRPIKVDITWAIEALEAAKCPN